MSFKIEKGIPIPARANSAGRKRIYPLDELTVGASFFVPNKSPNNLASSIIGARKRTGFAFTSRAVTENGVTGVRIWRTA